MDLNTQLSQVVEGLVADITANVLVRVDSAISNAINNRLASYDFSSHVQNAAASAFEKKVSEYTIDTKRLENKIVEKINETILDTQATTATLINQEIERRLATVNFQQAITDSVATIVADRLNNYVFPPASIPAEAVQLSNVKLSGDNISGGLIENFSSTGIDDRTTQIALTLLDDTTVIENNLLTKDLTVDGTVTVNGNFVVNGKLSKESNFYKTILDDVTVTTLSKLDTTFFNNYSNLIFNKIKDDGLDLEKITLGGKEIISDKALSPTIINSKLQTVGELKELKVSGESLIAQTLYTTAKRVGINTIEPGAALSIWDDEVEISVAKQQKDVGIIGTPRQQKLVLSSNNKNNLVLNTDGSVQVNEIRISNLKFTVSDKPPSFVSDRGHIVWNSNPQLGGPMGWICLGAANWANFGIID